MTSIMLFMIVQMTDWKAHVKQDVTKNVIYTDN